MKVISFSEVGFVRKILLGEKTQTIRPSFCKDCGTEDHYKNRKNRKGTYRVHKPRFKVGEEVKLLFKQRSTPKDSFFCMKCGRIVDKCMDGISAWADCPEHGNLRERFIKAFPKHFATVVITNIIEIEMKMEAKWKEDNGYEKWFVAHEPKNLPLKIRRWGFKWKIINQRGEFAEKDGFKNVSEMADWFHKRYDLSTPKRFTAYRFKLKEDT